MTESFANAASTTLNGGINNSVTSITVTSATGFPSSGNYRILVSAEGANTAELMTVTAGQGTTSWTVTRASETYAGSSSASAHGTGATVTHVLTSGGLSQTLTDSNSAAAPKSYEGYLGADVTIVNANTWYSHSNLALTPPSGDYLVIVDFVLSSASALQTGMAVKISTGGSLASNVLTGDTAVKSRGGVAGGLSTNDFPMSTTARVTVDGSTAIRGSALDTRGSSDGKILTTAFNGGTTNKASSITATKITSS